MFPSFNGRVSNDCVGVRVPRTMNNAGPSHASLAPNHQGISSSSSQPTAQRYSATFFECLVPVTRFWGIFTAIVLASVGVDFAFHRQRSGYYLIGGSIFLLLMEVLWVATLFMQLCVRNDSRVWSSWSIVQWFEGWKKSLVYVPMGAVPLLLPHKIWLSYVASGQLFALAVFHLAFSFKGRRRRRRKERLLHCDIDSFESSRFEDVTEVLDDCLPEPIPGSSHSLSDSLCEQDTILEI